MLVFHYLAHALRIAPAETQTSPAERTLLADVARGRRRGVEIGVYEGVNTRMIAQAMAPEGRLYGVDPFFTGRLGICWSEWIARREIRRTRRAAHVELVRMLSHEASHTISGDFDLLFIDGDHSLQGITTDWHDWSGRIEPGGVVALHDVLLTDAVGGGRRLGSHEYFESTISKDDRFEQIAAADSMVVLRRRT